MNTTANQGDQGQFAGTAFGLVDSGYFSFLSGFRCGSRGPTLQFFTISRYRKGIFFAQFLFGFFIHLVNKVKGDADVPGIM